MESEMNQYVLLALIVLGVLFLGSIVWMVYEVWTAPTIDEDGKVISDPYERMRS